MQRDLLTDASADGHREGKTIIEWFREVQGMEGYVLYMYIYILLRVMCVCVSPHVCR